MKTNRKRRTKFLSALLLLVLCIPQTVRAESYTYSLDGNAVETPDAAIVDTIVDSEYAKWGSLGISSPSDLAVGPDGSIYIADTGNNRIVVLDEDMHFKYQLATPLLPGDRLGRLYQPTGIFVDNNGLLYIADTGNNQVIVCNEEGVAHRVLTVEGKEVFDEDFVFKPIKVTADDLGNTYVISEGGYDGLLQFDSKGSFVGYLGANDVSVNAWDLLWKNISTQVQRKKMVKALPIEFSNLDIDSKGFVYTVTTNVDSTQPENDDPVRKQSALGKNILKSSTIFGKPVGDLEFPYWDDSSRQGASTFVDVSVQSYGYLCLDSNRGRIFAYGDTGEILFVVGGYGAESGKFTNPVSVDAHEDMIYILSKDTETITAFRLTDYGKLIIDARQRYLDGDYEGSENRWNEVLKLNSRLSIAQVGIGKVYYMQGEYAEAMKYLKLGGDKDTYSDAYDMYQQEIISGIFEYILVGIGVIILLLVIWYCYRKKHPKQKVEKQLPEWLAGLKYSFYIMTHPFDGFWDMTHEKRGNMISASIIYGAWVLVWILDKGITGFLFKELNSEFRLLEVLSIAFLPMILWCICNWAVSTLMDGDGKPSAIVMSTAYALTPYIIFKFITVLLSNVLTLDQSMVITVLMMFGTVWCAILLLVSVIQVHNYTLGRSVGVIFLIIAAMAIVVFLAIMMLNLVDQMRFFLLNLYQEFIINM